MESKLEFPESAILTPYNYFEWKPKIQLHLRSRGLFRITMETEVEPTSAVEKSRYFNRMDEAFGILCLSISPELLFYVESCSTPNQVWKILEELFGKQNEMLRMVEDSIAIYRNSRKNFSLEPEDPHVASLYATNYVQSLQETDDGDPNQSEGTIRGTGCANVACTGNEPKKDNVAAMAASLATGSGQAQAMNPALTSMGSLHSPLQTLNPPLNPGLSSALNPALSNSYWNSSWSGKENDPFSISGGFAAGSVPTSGFGQVHKPPSRTGGGSFAERLAARGGFNAPRLNTARLKSSYLTIPPGLSSTTLLDSPVLLSNSQAAQSPTTGSFPLPPFLHESSPLNSGSDGLKDNSYEDGTSSSFPLTSPTTLIAVASTMAEDFGSRSFSQLFAAPQIETPQNLKPLSPAGFNGSNSSQSYVLTKGWSRFSKKRSMEFRLLHCVAYGESWYEIGGSCAVEHVPDKIAVVSIGVVHGGVGLVGIAHGGPTGLCHDHRDVCEVQRGHGVVGRVDHGIEDVGIVEQCVGVNGLLVGQEQSEQSVVQRHHTVALHVDTEGLSRSVVAQNRSRAIEEKDGIDYAAVTVQLPGDERVPFLFTVKQLVASGTPESFSGQFLMPAYRGFSFLDPKGRGGSTGYDNAVALPAGGRGDEDELAKENIKVVSVSKGGITLSVSKSKPETHMVIGVFDSLQPSDTDLGSTAPKDVKIQGIWYAQIGKALALLALGSAITVTPYKIVPG